MNYEKKPANVVIIGCGNIGFRHLEGLSNSKHVVNAFVYDLETTALNEARERFLVSGSASNNLHVSWWQSLENLGATQNIFDFAILSTTATNRSNVFKDCKRSLNSSAWLFEKPLTQSAELLKLLLDETNGESVWVNHSRRSMDWFKEIEMQFKSRHPIKLKAHSPNLGIACNASHYVDLVNYLTDETPVFADTSALNDNWYAARRSGFFDVQGKMTVHFSGGSQLELICSDNLQKDYLGGHLMNKNEHFEIDEDAGIARLIGGVTVKGRISYQSELTGIVLDEILATRNCSLTNLSTAASCYKPIIVALEKHWSNSNQLSMCGIPVT